MIIRVQTLQRLVQFAEVFDDEVGVVLADPQFGGALQIFVGADLLRRHVLEHLTAKHEPRVFSVLGVFKPSATCASCGTCDTAQPERSTQTPLSKWVPFRDTGS